MYVESFIIILNRMVDIIYEYKKKKITIVLKENKSKNIIVNNKIISLLKNVYIFKQFCVHFIFKP